MKAWKDKATIDKLSDRLDRLESAKDAANGVVGGGGVAYATAEELEQMTPMQRYIAWFNWYVKTIMPYYKAEVMRVHNLTSEKYDRRTLEGDTSIYLSQPNRRFESTSYEERIAHVLELDYQGLQQKFKQGELKHLIADGLAGSSWRDEDPNAVF